MKLFKVRVDVQGPPCSRFARKSRFSRKVFYWFLSNFVLRPSLAVFNRSFLDQSHWLDAWHHQWGRPQHHGRIHHVTLQHHNGPKVRVDLESVAFKLSKEIIWAQIGQYFVEKRSDLVSRSLFIGSKKTKKCKKISPCTLGSFKYSTNNVWDKVSSHRTEKT